MAENNATFNRHCHLNRETQFAAAAIYNECFGNMNTEYQQFCIPATFQIINIIGWKPHPNHPTPLARGTGEISIKELHTIDKFVKK